MNSIPLMIRDVVLGIGRAQEVFIMSQCGKLDKEWVEKKLIEVELDKLMTAIVSGQMISNRIEEFNKEMSKNIQ